MISPVETPHFCLALERAHTAMSALIAEDLASVNIRRRDEPILRCISEMDNAVAIAIAQDLGVPRSTISRSLRRLERVGIVELRPGELFDSRSIRITLTVEGERVVALLRNYPRHIDAFFSLAMLRAQQSRSPDRVAGEWFSSSMPYHPQHTLRCVPSRPRDRRATGPGTA